MNARRGDARTRLVRTGWTFLSNHAHVLVCLARDSDMRMWEIADRVGITERATQAIVADLVTAGYLTRTRTGRRNHYTIHPDHPLRHPIEADTTIAEFLNLLGAHPDPAAAEPPHS